MKVQTHNSLEPPLEYNQDHPPLMTFLTILGVTEILCCFRLVLEGKTGKEIPESSRLKFVEKFLANNFALSDSEDNTSEPLNRRNIGDLPLRFTVENTINNSRKIPRALCKFCTFKKTFETITI